VELEIVIYPMEKEAARVTTRMMGLEAVRKSGTNESHRTHVV